MLRQVSERANAMFTADHHRQDSSADKQLLSNPVTLRLFPQQPITAEEKLELVKNDHLGYVDSEISGNETSGSNVDSEISGNDTSTTLADTEISDNQKKASAVDSTQDVKQETATPSGSLEPP